MQTLRQIHSTPQPHTQGAHAQTVAEREPHAQTAAERVFAHWVFMLGKNAARCVMGRTRHKALDRALTLYDEETLRLAIDGCAASRWHAGENERGRAFNDIELILRDEPHIEHFAELGDALRARAQAELERRARQAQAEKTIKPISGEDLAAAHRRLTEIAREIACRMRGAVR